jgi:hypothetical protein
MAAERAVGGGGPGAPHGAAAPAPGGAPPAPVPPAPAAGLTEFVNAKNTLLCVGSASLLAMFHFYKRKDTRAFKASWMVMWPTLGGGIMLAVQPDEAQMSKVRPRRRAAALRAASLLRPLRARNGKRPGPPRSRRPTPRPAAPTPVASWCPRRSCRSGGRPTRRSGG